LGIFYIFNCNISIFNYEDNFNGVYQHLNMFLVFDTIFHSGFYIVGFTLGF